MVYVLWTVIIVSLTISIVKSVRGLIHDFKTRKARKVLMDYVNEVHDEENENTENQ